jgi:hypothetical protein
MCISMRTSDPDGPWWSEPVGLENVVEDKASFLCFVKAIALLCSRTSGCGSSCIDSGADVTNAHECEVHTFVVLSGVIQARDTLSM